MLFRFLIHEALEQRSEYEAQYGDVVTEYSNKLRVALDSGWFVLRRLQCFQTGQSLRALLVFKNRNGARITPKFSSVSP